MMLPITNPKVQSLDPNWARFVGFSLLFDNPGPSYHRVGNSDEVRCDVDSSQELTLYRELSHAIGDFADSEFAEFGICLLPPRSYHVTFFDGGNQANADGAEPTVKSSLTDLIEGLPRSWRETHELVQPALKIASEVTTSLPVSFRFSHLKNWNHEVLVAALQPSNEESASILSHLIERRATLSSWYRENFGFGAGPKYTPHVSLAYFANRIGGEKASMKYEELEAAIRRRTAGLEINFHSISAYAFTDMATFFREPHPR